MSQWVYKKPEHEHGFGNLLIELSMLRGPEFLKPDGTILSVKCNLLHDSVYGYELSNCVHLDGFTRVSFEGKQPPRNIIMNDQIRDTFHIKIIDFLRPTDYMKGLIESHMSLLDGVGIGMCIRRGSCAPDSVQYKGELGNRPYQYFTDDNGMQNFEHIIKMAPCAVYVTSDSPATKNYLKEKFGNKIRTVDTVYTFTGTQDQVENQTIKNLQDVYLTWFLLSMCPMVFNTRAGEFRSTFGYTAAIYGKCKYMDVSN